MSSDFPLPFKKNLENSSVVFYQSSLDENYPIVQITQNVQSLIGYSREYIYRDPTFWMQHIHEEDRNEIRASFLNILDQDKRTFFYRFKHKNGHFIWLRDEKVVSRDENGYPEAITGTCIDVTIQKENEQNALNHNRNLEEQNRNLRLANRKLKRQRQQQNKVEAEISQQQRQLKLLEAAVSYINDMVIITKAPIDDPLNSRIVMVNDAFQKYTGYQTSEVMGRTPAFLHGSETASDKLKMIKAKIEKHESFRLEFINYKKNGEPFWVDLEMAPFPADEDNMEYWVGINRDITKRKEAEHALQEKEERYRAYTELSFDGIYEMAVDGTVLDCNDRACEIFGYDRDEFIGMDIKRVIPDKHLKHHPDQLSEKVTTGNDVVQRTYKRKDGTTFPCEINSKLYHRNNKNHVIAYVRDISDRVAYEEAIEQSLKEKSTLLAEVHHRVKNNLAVISGLLAMQTFNADNEDVIKELRESQSRIQSIGTVHELLYQSDSFSDIRLEEYIDELISYIASTFGHEGYDINIQKEIDPVSLNVIQAVPCGLLLNELITNAYKHAFPDNEGTIFIGLYKDGKVIDLEVSDNGIGLPNDFSIQNTSSLGISLINTFIDQLNGTLSIEGSPSASFRASFKVD